MSNSGDGDGGLGGWDNNDGRRLVLVMGNGNGISRGGNFDNDGKKGWRRWQCLKKTKTEKKK